ncbi:hypothetical protein K4F52_009441 [Lecanicillium sp. MT-2017a]|nr:hypothetical protein K4F52_009441 [Lecanicillium sp. MT-2017a]
MKLQTLQTLLGSAALILAPVADASATHKHLHRKHTHLHMHRSAESAVVAPASIGLEKRTTCQFPTDDDNLVAVTPDKMNGGWAMSPDRACTPGTWCPYACKPGMVMNQWDKDATYTYPESMNGGLYCDSNGKVSKPFPDAPYCKQGVGSVKAINKCAKPLSFCQTVLPGCESMLIPTVVNSISTLAVPDPSYWASTAAHFYVNPPGTGDEGCIWGSSDQPIGNWAAYVAGANTVANGDTFVKLGDNPIFKDSALKNTKPSYGLRIECPDGGCNGLPCEIQPGGGVRSSQTSSGAGGADFCVVTVAKGKTAHIVAFDGSGGNGGSDDDDETSSKSEPSSTAAPPPPPPPSTTKEPTTSSPPPPPTTISSVKTSTSMSTPSSSSVKVYPTVKPGIFHEEHNSTSTSLSSSSDSSKTTDIDSGFTSAAPPVATQTDKDNEAGRQQGSAAIAGLVVALVAAACLF